MPWWEALIAAGGNQTQSLEQAAYNINQSEVAWKRSIGADSTKHQREVQDLRKAGLNPILSAGNVAGAPHATPASPVQMPDVASASRVSQEGRRLALEARRVDNESAVAAATVTERMAQADLASKAASAKSAEEFRTWAEAARIDGLTALDRATAAQHWASAKKTRAETPVSEAKGEVGSFVRDLLSPADAPKNLGEWWRGTGVPGTAEYLRDLVVRGWKSAAKLFSEGQGNGDGGSSSAKAQEQRAKAYDNAMSGKGR